MKYVLLFLLLVSFVFAQNVTFKSGYQYPVNDVDSVHSGLAMIRGADYHPDPLGNGVAGFVVTNYLNNGSIHIFKNAGDDAMELVWSSPKLDSTTSTVVPRSVCWGDLDNDGTSEVMANFGTNGIQIFEWDEVADSWNFGTAPAKVIGSPLFPADSASYIHSEYIESSDLDNDGDNELYLASNFSGSTYDGFYIFSIVGQYSTGTPGFTSIKREGHVIRTGVYGNYGGGTPYAAIGANLDGAGTSEMIFHNWNNATVSPTRTTGIDTYELADTTGGGHFIKTTSTDAVSLGGGTAFDIDGDGREEVYIPLYGAPSAAEIVVMAHWEAGDDLTKVDSTNIFMMDLSSVYSSSSLYGAPGYGDYDQDGLPNLYFAGRQKEYIISAEFQGGDKTDNLNWTYENLYTGIELDSKILHSVTLKDSGSTVDTIAFELNSEWEGTIAFQLCAEYSDFDNDGYEDIILPGMGWYDSVAVTKLTWNGSSFDTSTYSVIEPYRTGSLRMLESDVLTGFKSKDITVITPNDYILKQNYPNPFNPETNIEFFLPIKKKISLIVYNALGQKVKSLISDEVYNHGSHTVTWDATNEAGSKVATGMYVYSLKFGNFYKNMKMMLVK